MGRSETYPACRAEHEDECYPEGEVPRGVELDAGRRMPYPLLDDSDLLLRIELFLDVRLLCGRYGTGLVLRNP